VKQKKWAVIKFSLGLMAAIFSLESKSFNFTNDFNQGIYWRSFPVQMTRFAVDPNDRENLQSLVDRAVEEWNNSIGRTIWSISDVVNSNEVSGNFIKWSEDFGNETGFDPGRTLAVTVRYNDGSFFNKVVIILNGSHATLRQNFSNTLYKTILHELGHTVGLDHSEQHAIMAPSISSLDTLTTDDINGMEALFRETESKQLTGFTANLNGNSDSNGLKLLACGSVEDINKSAGPGGGNFALSLGIGLIFAILFLRIKKSLLV
jgi:Matrixin